MRKLLLYPKDEARSVVRPVRYWIPWLTESDL